MMIDDREYLTPPDNEERKFTECCSCGENICSGEKYYNFDGEHYCKSCGDFLFLKIAENE